ncbi:hypothetical protein AVEN_154150-1 [Araneus ventricosus]|uniref:Uncharacterized protein n=1 Tax=Araneus ventricosus TaxID=182803 RepID=A0A4Y2WFY3_ARAVE|nr:hypothetical protein AVEN_113100-1 [Araneus ventricosus]GBO35520.1 hypothetical protein AVEN_154150-1 [Araneus ventricosus]
MIFITKQGLYFDLKVLSAFFLPIYTRRAFNYIEAEVRRTHDSSKDPGPGLQRPSCHLMVNSALDMKSEVYHNSCSSACDRGRASESSIFLIAHLEGEQLHRPRAHFNEKGIVERGVGIRERPLQTGGAAQRAASSSATTC